MQSPPAESHLNDALADLTPYERLVRLALTALGLLTAVALFCVLPWRGLLTAATQPAFVGLHIGAAYIALRVALRVFPWVAGLGLLISWGLFGLRRPRAAFYAALISLGMLLLTGLVVLAFSLSYLLG